MWKETGGGVALSGKKGKETGGEATPRKGWEGNGREGQLLSPSLPSTNQRKGISMNPGHYVTGYREGWGVVLWDGIMVVSRKFIGPVGAVRTNFLDKAMDLAVERNRRDGFDVGDSVYCPNLERRI